MKVRVKELRRCRELFLPDRGIALFVSAFFLVSCATTEKAETVQLKRLTEAVLQIRLNYIDPLDEQVLANAALEGMNRTVGASEPSRAISQKNPWATFNAAYLSTLERNPARHPQELIDGAISSVVGLLDRHSRYYSAAEMRDLQDPSRQAAVGITFQRTDGHVVIVGVVEGSVAEGLQLKNGDRLLKIGDEPVNDLLLDAIVRRLRGKPGSLVSLTIERNGEIFEALAKRSAINYSSLDSALYPGGIAYVRIRHFYDSTRKEFDKHIAGILLVAGTSLRGIVLDLRSNSGGVLNEVIGVADAFLDDGIILYVEGRGKDNRFRFSATQQTRDLGGKIPLMVLVDGETASGAEMLAGILQDRKRARIVGASTFGLGSIQSLFPLAEGGSLKLTTARVYLPSSLPLTEAGVIPDICFKNETLIFLDSVQLRKSENTGGLCRNKLRFHLYQKDSDDIELRAALNMLRGYKGI